LLAPPGWPKIEVFPVIGLSPFFPFGRPLGGKKSLFEPKQACLSFSLDLGAFSTETGILASPALVGSKQFPRTFPKDLSLRAKEILLPLNKSREFPSFPHTRIVLVSFFLRPGPRDNDFFSFLRRPVSSRKRSVLSAREEESSALFFFLSRSVVIFLSFENSFSSSVPEYPGLFGAGAFKFGCLATFFCLPSLGSTFTAREARSPFFFYRLKCGNCLPLGRSTPGARLFLFF